MNIRPGIKLLEERKGSGRAAEKGCHATITSAPTYSRATRFQSNRRDTTVPWPKEMLASDDKGELINFVCAIGKRDAFAAVEYALIG